MQYSGKYTLSYEFHECYFNASYGKIIQLEMTLIWSLVYKVEYEK